MHPLRRVFYILLVLVLPTAGAAGAYAAGAVDELQRGPKVGTAIPHSLKVPDQHGQERDFKALARKRGLVILFSRSLGW